MLFKETIKGDLKAQAEVRVWVEALRSGRYEQCTSWLHRKDNGFCCLGVVLDQIDSTAWKPGRFSEKALSWRDPRFGELLPKDVVDSLHLYDGSGSFFGEDNDELDEPEFLSSHPGIDINHPDIYALTGMNDGGRTFFEIADVIEKALEEVLAKE